MILSSFARNLRRLVSYPSNTFIVLLSILLLTFPLVLVIWAIGGPRALAIRVAARDIVGGPFLTFRLSPASQTSLDSDLAAVNNFALCERHQERYWTKFSMRSPTKS